MVVDHLFNGPRAREGDICYESRSYSYTRPVKYMHKEREREGGGEKGKSACFSGINGWGIYGSARAQEPHVIALLFDGVLVSCLLGRLED